MTKTALLLTGLTIFFLFSLCDYSHARRYQDGSSHYDSFVGVSPFQKNDDENWFLGIIVLGGFVYVLFRYCRFMDPTYGDGVKEFIIEILPNQYDYYGYDMKGFNREGFNREGFDRAGFDREGFGRESCDHDGYNHEEYNQYGFNKNGFAKDGSYYEGFDQKIKSRDCAMCGIPIKESERRKFIGKSYCSECENKARSKRRELLAAKEEKSKNHTQIKGANEKSVEPLAFRPEPTKTLGGKDKPECAMCGIFVAEGERKKLLGQSYCSVCVKKARSQRRELLAAKEEKGKNSNPDRVSVVVAKNIEPSVLEKAPIKVVVVKSKNHCEMCSIFVAKGERKKLLGRSYCPVCISKARSKRRELLAAKENTRNTRNTRKKAEPKQAMLNSPNKPQISKRIYDAEGFDQNGYNRYGYDKDWCDREGYHVQGTGRKLRRVAPGFCHACGEEIDSRRLEIYPESRLCVPCKSAREKI